MIRNQLFIAAALLVGVGIGYFLRTPDSPAVPSEDGGAGVASKIEDVGADASLRSFKARIAELERQLADERQRSQAALASTGLAQSVDRPERHGPPSMAEMRSRMEKLAKEDPQRFAQMTNRMARFRQRRLARTNAKLDFLSSVDASAMTDEQRKTHEAYQELLARREELEDRMHNPETSDADREALMREMHETRRAMRTYANQERQTLIAQTAQALGYSGDDAAAICSTVNDIISSTENGHDMPPPPPDGGMPPSGAQHP